MNVRVPREDRRQARGDAFAGDAWRDVTTGELFYVVVGIDMTDTPRAGVLWWTPDAIKREPERVSELERDTRTLPLFPDL